MSKYIVKNCPSIKDGKNVQNVCINANTYCEFVADCLIKQVIEKCKNYDKAIQQNSLFFKSIRVIVRDILQLFEIEECE